MLLKKEYKSKVLRFKLDEDPLQHRIYFLTFTESLEMVFPHYKETWKVLIYYSNIGKEDIKCHVNKSIRKLLYENIDFHSRRRIAEFLRDGVKRISKLQSHCGNIAFDDKIRYDRIFEQVTHKGGESEMKYIKKFKNKQALSVSVGNSYYKDHLMHIFLDKFNQGGKYTS